MKVEQLGPAGKITTSVSVFLHGFPGLRSKQNREIAEAVAESTGFTTYLLYYAGLSQAPGTFSFQSCFEEVIAWFAKELPNWSSYQLIGHSWGGFLSLNVAAKWPRNLSHLVLLSPLLKFAGPELAEPSFAQTAHENPSLSMIEAAELASDFARVGQAVDAESLAAKVRPETKVLLLQAREDAITPPEHAQSLAKKFAQPPHFELAENDHSFLANRPQLSAQIARFLKT